MAEILSKIALVTAFVALGFTVVATILSVIKIALEK